MKKWIFLSPIFPFLFGCAPFKKPDPYVTDAQKLYSAKRLWEEERRQTFQLKELYLRVSANRKAIEELNRQMEKQNRINKEFAGRLRALESELSRLEERCLSVSNATSSSEGDKK